MTSFGHELVEIALERSCGCRDVWTVPANTLGDEPLVLQGSQACLPEICQACTDRGEPCEVRKDMSAAVNYEPVQFSEVTPKRYTRLKGK